VSPCHSRSRVTATQRHYNVKKCRAPTNISPNAARAVGAITSYASLQSNLQRSGSVDAGNGATITSSSEAITAIACEQIERTAATIGGKQHVGALFERDGFVGIESYEAAIPAATIAAIATVSRVDCDATRALTRDLERSVAIAEEQRNGAAALIGHGEVKLPIAIEIT
jgi:hypothetical protein